jgi:hypothetical protein
MKSTLKEGIIFFMLSFLSIACSSPKLSHEATLFLMPEREMLFRGIELGTDKEDLVRLEQSLKIVSENSAHIIYTLSMSPTESANFHYEFNIMDKVTKIQADYHTANQENQTRYFDEISDYYCSLLGSPTKKTPTATLWNNYEKEYQVVLEKKVMKTSYDIHLLIMPIINTPPAIAIKIHLENLAQAELG